MNQQSALPPSPIFYHLLIMQIWMGHCYWKRMLLPALNMIMEKLIILMNPDWELNTRVRLKNKVPQMPALHLYNSFYSYHHIFTLKLSGTYILSLGLILKAE